MNNKYEFVDGDTKEFNGKTLRRIRSLVVIGELVYPGDLGGYIESESNLDTSGNAWVSGDAQVSGNAWVSGDAWVYGNAWVDSAFIPRKFVTEKTVLTPDKKALKEAIESGEVVEGVSLVRSNTLSIK